MTWEFRNESEVLELFSRAFTLPTTYLVLDCETTGFSREQDYIIDVGWLAVQNNVIVDGGSCMLDWSRVSVDHGYIQSQLLRQATEYGRVGRRHQYPYERLCREGEEPLQVLHEYVTRIYNYIAQKAGVIIGHGFWNFDREMLNAHTQRYFDGYVLPWQPNSIFDTGLLEKAAQSLIYPYAGETLDTWYHRVDDNHIRVKYNLESHCVPKYRLVERYSVSADDMHTAACDCKLIYCLYDTYRQFTEILNGTRETLTGRKITDR